nr:hypothetical protein [Candidatus Gracilibacteria bacterium]
MNKVAGNITFEQKIKFEIKDIYFVESENINGTFTYFFYGKTYINSSSELLKSLDEKANINSINHDVSISTEDNIEVYQDRPIDGVYTITSIEGNEENFDSVIEKFAESSPFIVSIREVESSLRFGNRIIRIDIVN